jgi:hypothetical protein
MRTVSDISIQVVSLAPTPETRNLPLAASEIAQQQGTTGKKLGAEFLCSKLISPLVMRCHGIISFLAALLFTSLFLVGFRTVDVSFKVSIRGFSLKTDRNIRRNL